MGLPAVKDSWEPSSQLEFDEFDGSAVDDGKHEDKVSDQPPAEDRGDAGGGEEDEVSESGPRKKAKPPTCQRLTNTNDNGKWVIWFTPYIAAR